MHSDIPELVLRRQAVIDAVGDDEDLVAERRQTTQQLDEQHLDSADLGPDASVNSSDRALERLIAGCR